METRDYFWLIVIIGVLGGAIWINLNPAYPFQQGLDLQGGLQVLLEADVPAEEPVTEEQMSTTRQIISQRINALGVTEPLVQEGGDRRILIELPGLDNPEQAISLVQETALLEFVDSGTTPLPEGLCIRTTENLGLPSPCEDEAADAIEPPTFDTVLTGAMLQEASAQTAQNLIDNYVAFTLTEEGGRIFQEYTSTHISQFLTIVLDKKVISSPQIQAVIERQGTITGSFTRDEAQNLALQLRYGALPVPLRIDGVRQVGATLGEQSIEASIRAGVIGLVIVLLFMLIYYRLPGGLADLALVFYAILNFAVFKLLGVTMTLPAITGFLLSTGMAVDANILVFERMKEELRAGEPLGEAIIAGFGRAWSSIRDSNVATIVVCMILLIFGRGFGASTVQGFAWTLMIGVFISMFTAVLVTRTLVKFVMYPAADWLKSRGWLLGL